MNRRKRYTVNDVFDAVWDGNVSEMSDLDSDHDDHEEIKMLVTNTWNIYQKRMRNRMRTMKMTYLWTN